MAARNKHWNADGTIMVKILTPLELQICYDQANGCIRPHWEGGAPQGQRANEGNTENTASIIPPKIAIHCHVFYVALLPELIDAWRVIKRRQILISTDTEVKASIIERILELHGEIDSVIKVCRNRGRDLGPLLTAFKEEMEGYNILIHCHTKKTPQEERTFGTSWRRLLTATTFPSSPSLLSTIYKLISSPRSGLIMAWPHHVYAHNVNWGKNFIQTRKLLRHLDYDVKRFDMLYFPAGSFFWIQLDLIRELGKLNLRPEDFCGEPTPSDGCLAHALERSLGVLPMLQGRDSYAVWLGRSKHALASGPLDAHIAQLPSQQHIESMKSRWFRQGLSVSLGQDRLREQSIPIGCLGDYQWQEQQGNGTEK